MGRIDPLEAVIVELRARSLSGISPGRGRESGEEEDDPSNEAVLVVGILGGLGIPQSFLVLHFASAREHRSWSARGGDAVRPRKAPMVTADQRPPEVPSLLLSFRYEDDQRYVPG